MFAPGPQADGFAQLADAVRLVRYSGDCVNYGLLAAGHVDLVVENQLAPYDILALIPIVRASGAVIASPEGETPVEGGYVIAAATPELWEAARQQLF
jgi:myo-inositol-1(or 4)-monophosphatase